MTVKKITKRDAVKAKLLYIDGKTISEICSIIPEYTRNQWNTKKRNERWDQDRNRYQNEFDEVMKYKLMTNKKLILDSILLLYEQLHDNIINQQIAIKSISDVEKMLKMICYLSDDVNKKVINDINDSDDDSISDEASRDIMKIIIKDRERREAIGNNDKYPYSDDMETIEKEENNYE